MNATLITKYLPFKTPVWIAYFAEDANGVVRLGGGPGYGDTRKAAIDNLRNRYPNTWNEYSPKCICW